MTRLRTPALKGTNKLLVEPNLDMVPGDRLGMLPTSYDPHATDDVFVQSYDIVTGEVVLTANLNYYHWGQEQSTGPDYNGVDMRGEVLLLTRNVKIDAEDIESWGGQIVTSDTIEIYDGEMTMRTGSTVLDNVEIFNCSQIDTLKSAIRFESAATSYSEVTNSAIHNGYSWGAYIGSSANILIKGNNFFNFRPIGLAIRSSRNVTVDNNVIGNIVERTTLEADLHSVDKGGAFSICAYWEPDNCQDIKVRNNLAGGSTYAGFVTPGHDCGDYDSFGGNVAHSIKGMLSGHGLYFKNSAQQTVCTEYSYFAGYKCYYNGAFTYPKNVQARMTHITAIDNREGFGVSIENKALEYDTDRIGAILSDIYVFGETASPDCPQDGNGGFCNKYHKKAFTSAIGTWKGKDFHIGTASPLPPHNVMGIMSWWTKVVLNRVTFKDIRATTMYGMDYRAFAMNPWSSDMIPMQYFYDTQFINCEADSLAYFMEPPQKWAIIKDCGAWPCTGPKNTMFWFYRSKFQGLRPSWAREDFQMIPDTPGLSEFVPNCVKQEKMNLWTCENQDLGQLMFESEDSDTLDRSMQPIYARLQGTDINNKVNSFMDHVWDGFYTGQTRLSRFPILVYSPRGSVYDIIYTGSPAKKMRYTLWSDNDQLEMIVRIAYPGAESRQIIKDGKRVDMNQWDEGEKMYGPVKRKFCGENRYIGVKNILEFYLTKGCVLHIAPRDAIQTMVRMEWTMDEFFSKGGTTQFIDRVAGSLGIHASTIKVVSVYEGSVVLNYDITVDDDGASSKQAQKTLAKIQAKQTQQFATGKMDLGAPILDVQASVSVSEESTSSTSNAGKVTSIISGGVVSAPGYEPITISTAANTEPEVVGGVFVPDIPIMQVDNYYTVQQSETVDRTEVVTQMNKWQGGDIVQIQDREITILEGTDNTAVFIIVAAAGLIVLVVIGLIVRFIMNKMRAEKARAAHIKRTQANLNKDGVKVIPTKRNQVDNKPKGNGGQQPDVDPGLAESPSMEIFEEQYDPNQEFRIFGIGDKTKGGVQSLQEKMNMADDVKSEDDSSETEKEDDDVENVTPAKAADSLGNFNPQSDNKMNVSIRSSSSTMSKRGLLMEKTPQGSIYQSDHKKESNKLAEDDEIQELEDEE